MSKIFTAKEICERALRAIGAFPVTESAPDGEQLREAMLWLDLIMAEKAGTSRLFFLIPATIGFDITNGTSSYNLGTAFGADLPVDGIQFPVAAYLEDSAGNRRPIKIVTRDKFMETSDPDATGEPCFIFIDRLATPTPILKIRPTPAADDTTTYTIKLDVQTYAKNVAPAGVSGTQPSDAVQHEFRVAWQRWLIVQLAHDLGSGPIFKISESRLNRFATMAGGALEKLEGFENHEHETTPPICDSWG